MKIPDGQTIESWFLSLEERLSVFPDKFNYVERYKHIRGTLRNNIHKYIDQGAQQAEHKNAKKEKKTLTGHGPEHFEDLIDATTKLVKAEDCDLDYYEVYLLLAAIQTHDIGNIIGRENHESKMREVFYDIFEGDRSLENVENDIFLSIAEVHSGNNDGDKDTIGKLSNTSNKNVRIRMQLLASILRFADELTDNPKRVPNYLIEKGLIEPESEIYHEYAKSLKSTEIIAAAKEISLYFKFDAPVGLKKYQKDSKRQYLLDEIFERTKKVHTEKVYCMRYMHPYCPIKHINIEITIFTEGYKEKMLRIAYRLIDSGYPEYIMDKKIWDLCESPESLVNQDRKHWTGTILRTFIRDQQGK